MTRLANTVARTKGCAQTRRLLSSIGASIFAQRALDFLTVRSLPRDGDSTQARS
jgi:hypothetical protein